MGVNLNSNTFNSTMETLKNATKLAANLTDSNKQKQLPEKKTENMNQPHTQTVEVKVGEQNPVQKPTIIKEKSETHVHKVFPDNRELSEKECAVRELELKQDHEYKMKELDFRMAMEEQYRKERKEREEYERKERERRREKDRKFARNLGIFMGAVGAAALGFAAYDFYTSSRGAQGRKLALREPKVEIQLTPDEGSVK